MKIKRYSELIRLPTFEERFQYASLKGKVGESTFGFDRYMNQMLYSSREWKHIRNKAIGRDNACDLACEDYDLGAGIIVHHLNPITIEDIEDGSSDIFSLDNLICVSSNTHKAIHFGDASLLTKKPVDRFSWDTCPWKV